MPQDRTVANLSVTPALDSDALPTVRVSPAGRKPLSALTSRGPIEVVAGSTPRLTTESDQLKQRRLRAAALYFLVVLATFLVWRLLQRDRGLWPLHLSVMTGMGSVLLLLSDPRPMSGLRLTILEIATFGMMAMFLAFRQYDAMLMASETDQVRAVQVASKNTVACSMIVVFAYALLIPNTWKRSARFVLALIFVPMLTQALVYAIHPTIFRMILGTGDWTVVSENMILASISAGLAIFGTHVINTLRVEAFQAKQLNQYKLGEHLGEGGMGEVFSAEHRMLKRPCAIKLIRSERASDPASHARFEREVRATAKLSHPNTVEIYDYGHTDDGVFYYVMELLHGMSLAEIVDRFGPMPPGRVVYLLKASCEALAEAHSVGMIHRDLKPANIFAARRGGRHDTAKLLDFGLVKGGDDDPEVLGLSREGTVRGTPLYMAPEQATAEKDLDHRCDIYAMGAVAYFLLTGHPPFEGDNSASVMIAQVRDPVVPPSQLNPNVPADLEAVVLKCLAKKRDDRYPDAESLAEALGACECARDWDSRKAAQWWSEVGLD